MHGEIDPGHGENKRCRLPKVFSGENKREDQGPPFRSLRELRNERQVRSGPAQSRPSPPVFVDEILCGCAIAANLNLSLSLIRSHALWLDRTAHLRNRFA
jgi:hypothetical protein